MKTRYVKIDTAEYNLEHSKVSWKTKRLFGFILGFFLLIVLVSFAYASPDLDIQKKDKGSVVIAELENPAVFDFLITNNDGEDNFEIYSFSGVSFSPKGTFILPSGKKTIEVKAYPSKGVRGSFKGIYDFEYELRGQSSGIYKDHLAIKIVTLKDAVQLQVMPISPGEKNVEIFLVNKENTNIEDLTIKTETKFFNLDEKISLKPYEKISINKSANSGLIGITAGKYTSEAELSLGGSKVKLPFEIQYTEKEEIKTESVTEGFIIRTTTDRKINQGNVPATAEIIVSKNLLTRLFTHFSAEPKEVIRRGLIVEYVWSEVIGPGASLSVNVTTNYTIPLLLIIFVVFIGVVARLYFLTDVVLGKKVSLVRTRGGEFALRVVLNVRARKSVTSGQLIDHIPGMAKIYEGFGKRPDKIDEQHRRLEWNIGNMRAGEERAYSYVIYSKLRAVGRFELPVARLAYQKDGASKFVNSNKAYFVSDSVAKIED